MAKSETSALKTKILKQTITSSLLSAESGSIGLPHTTRISRNGLHA
ncbi:hypothetical protein SynMVIR181_01664 [Synechococcus sp. MVIR-18-1]|nr:hypothetical protein SynMVIR181_01664 [Synechococcus sp. MVIR-18-1]